LRRNKEVYLLAAIILISFAMIYQCSIVLPERNIINESQLNSNPLNTCADSITIQKPWTGDSWAAGTPNWIIWTWVGSFTQVIIILTKSGGGSSTIANYALNNGSYEWNIPINQGPGSYNIEVQDFYSSSVYDISGTFTIHTGYWIIVDTPNSFISWVAGSSYNIVWISNSSGQVDIKLYKSGIFKETIATNVADINAYVWMVPSSESAGSDYQVRVVDHNHAGVYGDSDDFSITLPSSVPGFAWEYALFALSIGIAIVITLLQKKYTLHIISQ